MTPVARARGLTRRFGAITAVDGVDLTIPRGEIVGFLGPNGAGKTTTLRLLLGLLQPDAGEVELFGLPLIEHRHTVLTRIGALIETPSLYPHLSSRENLDIDRRLRGLPADGLDGVLSLVGLATADRPVAGFSLGMRQRLGLALALLGSPELLILDEPTNGLDPAGIAEMRLLLHRLANDNGTTILLSSHLLSEIEQVATHLIVLRAGHVVYQGPTSGFVGRQNLSVGTDRPAAAVDLLAGHGWQAAIVPTEPGLDIESTLVVEASGREARAEICRLLVGNGHAVYQLSEAASSLETAFFEETVDPVGGME